MPPTRDLLIPLAWPFVALLLIAAAVATWAVSCLVVLP